MPRHQREVERHVAFVAAGGRVAEVLDHVGRPLVGLGQQHPARELVVDHLAAVLEEGVRLGQVLAVGALPLEQIGHRVQPEPVDAQVQPEPQDVDHRLLHGGVVVVQVGLVGEEPVPVELLAHRVEGPVGLLGVDEDDPRVGVALAGVAPHVEVAVGPVGVAPRLLEPRVGVGGVVHHQVGDDPDAAPVGGVEQGDEVVDGAELGQHLGRSRGCRSRRRATASRRTAAATGSRHRATAGSRAARSARADRLPRRRWSRRRRAPAPRRTPRS